MQLMVEGDKWELYIPSDLAYGSRGRPPTIPGDSALVFTIEMIEIQGQQSPASSFASSFVVDSITSASTILYTLWMIFPPGLF